MIKAGVHWQKAAAVISALVFFTLMLLVAPQRVAAASDEIYSVDISVELHEDGSASITQVWDLSVSSGGEWYVSIPNLDNMQISNLTVTDENGLTFENVDNWDSSLSREERAYKSGIIAVDDGYELCWGFGEYGAHTYTVQFDITNLVKGYKDANGITFVFLRSGLSTKVENVHISIFKEGVALTQENAGAWVFSIDADYGFEDGKIFVQSTSPMQTSQSAMVMVEFEQSMFSPLDVKNESFEDVKASELEGSDYLYDDDYMYEDDYHGYSSGVISTILNLLLGLFQFAVIAAIVAGVIYKSKKTSGVKMSSGMGMKKEYNEAPYSREMPFHGKMFATYLRLEQMNQLQSEGDIIGAMLLKWMCNGQVTMVKQKAGFFGNKEEDAVYLYAARPEMPVMERQLYDMLMSAAGSDFILQSKEFERWSTKHYSRVEQWMNAVRQDGRLALTAMGAVEQTEQPVFFGLTTVKRDVLTPVGEQLTVEMFGFKKYLLDFTIINEREAREVVLWNDYLVFAQLFGIADKVAEQFKQLYPDYFTQMAANAGLGNVNAFDFYMLTRISHSYGRAMSRGYHSGHSAAQARASGGGGHSSFGGGGGGHFSGGGGGGGGGGGSR